MRTNRKRRKEEDSEVSSDWMNVYGDMVTLLLTFFVLLFSFSTIDAEKWRAIVKTFGSGGKVIVVNNDDESNGGNPNNTATSEIESIAPVSEPPQISSTEVISSSSSPPVSKPPVSKPPVSKPPVSKPPVSSTAPSQDTSSEESPGVFPGFEKLYDDLIGYVSGLGNSDGVTIDRGEGAIRIRFIGTILFEPSSAAIKSDSLKVIQDISQIINEHIDSINFMESQGHTDNSPLTNEEFKDNWELSGIRAYNVLSELIKSSNIDKGKIKFSGFGEEHPIDTNETQEGRDKNNRVDIIIS